VLLTDEQGRPLCLREIPGHLGYYVDQLGGFWSRKNCQGLRRKKINGLHRNKAHKDTNGQLLMIWICPSPGIKIGYALARLVLALHVAPCPDPTDPNWHPEYVDGDRRNCQASNLRWVRLVPRQLWRSARWDAQALGF
jgi:hypothetical protein